MFSLRRLAGPVALLAAILAVVSLVLDAQSHPRKHVRVVAPVRTVHVVKRPVRTIEAGDPRPFRDCPAGKGWVMSLQRCVPEAPPMALPSYVWAAWKHGCPSGEILAGTGINGEALSQYGNDGCVLPGSRVCYASEPTCDPANEGVKP